MLLGITKYHHFNFEKDEVRVKPFANSEEESFNLRTGQPPSSDVEILYAAGLSLERKWYLYQKVRDLCCNSERKDSVAPKPDKPLPQKGKTEVTENNSEDEDDVEAISTKKRKGNQVQL